MDCHEVSQQVALQRTLVGAVRAYEGLLAGMHAHVSVKVPHFSEEFAANLTHPAAVRRWMVSSIKTGGRGGFGINTRCRYEYQLLVFFLECTPLKTTGNVITTVAFVTLSLNLHCKENKS